MFGESDSESPRVPSPWDTIISTPPSPSPSPLNIPRLVPESDEGNIEYKLQLLDPSPARFARLVTQMKWRLLEGGGQAYYELGVADSGMLVGLPRNELEQSLETLEMMAGEIGASVIVVKEIEVPAAIAGYVSAQSNSLNGKRLQKRPGLLMSSEDDSNTTTATDFSVTDAEEFEGMGMFSMDDVEDEDALVAVPPIRFSVDLEIASVFKPRPMRARAHVQPEMPLSSPKKTKRTKGKKGPHLPDQLNSFAKAVAAELNASRPEDQQFPNKAHSRRVARDRRREERKKALMQYEQADVSHSLVSSLGALQITMDPATAETNSHEQTIAPDFDTSLPTVEVTTTDEAVPKAELVADNYDDDDDDVFPSPVVATPGVFTSLASSTLAVPVTPNDSNIDSTQVRLIVEALVVRKMSIEEAFLDFGGFSPM
ncbi:unnamed protein product [Mycena citricolor]|uniref:GTP binding protein 2 n=1 Tax=Mycena citricolor TaxID=2018698 RepID=A0AAD2HAB8_9AGAR|nr:unnamed protein product [Mycena citricolor]CAK5271812.1 unnamed protein product [Mycena citricolor]